MPELNPNYTLEDIAHLSARPRPVDTHRSDQGKAILAVGAAAMFPGLGHLLAGKPRAAAAIALVALCMIAAAASTIYNPDWLPIMVGVIPFAMVFELVQMMHAARAARRSQFALVPDISARFLLGVVFSCVGMAECYSVTRYVQNNWLEICYSPTPSMSPNISPGDYFLKLNGTVYHRWDIVGLDVPEGFYKVPRLCKRVIGLPGETVEITGPALLINGKPVQIPAGAGPYLPVDTSNNTMADAEPLSAGNGCWGRPITLGPDEYFVLGDNTSESFDSRFWSSLEGRQAGAVPKKILCGRIVAIIWPPDRWRVFKSGDETK
jgi:signal peptidase I